MNTTSSLTRALTVLGVILILVLTVSCSSRNTPDTTQQLLLATPTLDPSLPTPTLTAFPVTVSPTVSATPTVTVTPVASDEWVVSEILEPVTIGRYRYAIVLFKNLGNGATQKGQCQQPAWPMPEIGHVYKFVNTFGDYWLFVPIEGIDSTFQRFAPIP